MTSRPARVLFRILLAIAAASSMAAAPDTQPASSQPSTMTAAVVEPSTKPTTQPTDQPADAREGTLTDLVGQVIYNAKHEPNFRFKSAGDERTKTLPILPNRNLERMEQAIQSNGSDAWFRVSVVYTTYMNHNYLLVQDVSLLLSKQ